MTRLLIPMRVLADVVFTVLGIIELKKQTKAHKLKKQTVTPSSDEQQD